MATVDRSGNENRIEGGSESDVKERLAWVKVCLTCDGNGSVDDEEEGLLWVCPSCNGSGDEGIVEPVGSIVSY